MVQNNLTLEVMCTKECPMDCTTHYAVLKLGGNLCIFIHHKLCTCVMRNKTDNCIYRYVNSLYYKLCSFLHVLATYCGHLQGGVL